MPVLARVRAQTTMLSRIHLGELPREHDHAGRRVRSAADAARSDGRAPADAARERQRRAHAAFERRGRVAFPADARSAAALEEVSAGVHRTLRVAAARLTLCWTKADEETRRFVETMVGRAPDARRLAELLRTGGAAQLIADTTLKIVVADRAEVEQTATRWLRVVRHALQRAREGVGRRVEPAAHGVCADRGRAAVGGSLRSAAADGERVLRRPPRLEQLRSRLRSEPGHRARPQVRRRSPKRRCPHRSCSAARRRRATGSWRMRASNTA